MNRHVQGQVGGVNTSGLGSRRADRAREVAAGSPRSLRASPAVLLIAGVFCAEGVSLQCCSVGVLLWSEEVMCCCVVVLRGC
eukprot:3065565-Rhodomonas_salina.1